MEFKYAPGDRVSFTSVLTDGRSVTHEGAVLKVLPDDPEGRVYRVALDSMLWHGILLAQTEHRLVGLGTVDARALRWLKDQELVKELEWMGMWEHAERLEELVGKRYDGIER